jgi:ADP-ribosyl-[dinitrogen reductase] hydrolase
MILTLQSRLCGVALGAAVGDALGMPLEFRPATPPDAPVRDMLPGRLPAGSFTDDTEMALALAESLLAHQPLDIEDLAQRFVSWYHSSPPDIGYQTSFTLGLIAAGASWEEAARRSRRDAPDSAGNGSVMRCWPVAIACHADHKALRAASEAQSLITHPHPECVAGCVFVNGMIFEFCQGASLPQAFQATLGSDILRNELLEIVEAAPGLSQGQLKNSGWVRHTLQSAVWALFNSHSFEEALVLVANLGNDTDTAAAVTGAMAGALYGVEAIPARWSDALRGEWPLHSGKTWHAADFIQLADRLAGLSEHGSSHA